MHIKNLNLWCNHYEKQCGGSSKKLKIGLSDDPAIPLLGILLKKVKNTNLKRYMDHHVHYSTI